jgi:hypothetical protein
MVTMTGVRKYFNNRCRLLLFQYFQYFQLCILVKFLPRTMSRMTGGASWPPFCRGLCVGVSLAGRGWARCVCVGRGKWGCGPGGWWAWGCGAAGTAVWGCVASDPVLLGAPRGTAGRGCGRPPAWWGEAAGTTGGRTGDARWEAEVSAQS